MEKFNDLFKEYEQLAEKAEIAFQALEKEYGDCVKCSVNCSDCCHSVFGLFLIESAYLSHYFGQLDSSLRTQALLRGERADRELLQLESSPPGDSHPGVDDQGGNSVALERQRIRCPLLNEEEKCQMYSHRPITCRVYGIPTFTGGKLRACWKSGFRGGVDYPAFDLDIVYQELYLLSKKFLELSGIKDMDRAALLLSVPKSISTPLEGLINIK